MANARAQVRQSDLTRYIKAVVAAGFKNLRVTVYPNGSVTLEDGTVRDTTANPCDELLR